jgi:hypothetical protein
MWCFLVVNTQHAVFAFAVYIYHIHILSTIHIAHWHWHFGGSDNPAVYLLFAYCILYIVDYVIMMHYAICNYKCTRVSIHRDAGQCAENAHSQNRKAAGKSRTVLAYNYRTTGGKNAPCLLPSSSFHFAYGYTCPGLHFFRTQRIPTCLSVWFSHP